MVSVLVDITPPVGKNRTGYACKTPHPPPSFRTTVTGHSGTVTGHSGTVTAHSGRPQNRSRSIGMIGHDRPESPVTTRRNQRSRTAGIRTLREFETRLHALEQDLVDGLEVEATIEETQAQLESGRVRFYDWPVPEGDVYSSIKPMEWVLLGAASVVTGANGVLRHLGGSQLPTLVMLAAAVVFMAILVIIPLRFRRYRKSAGARVQEAIRTHLAYLNAQSLQARGDALNEKFLQFEGRPN